MELSFGFGQKEARVNVPDQNLIAILKQHAAQGPACCGATAVQDALRRPIGAPRLRGIVKPGEKVAIVTSDITRPMPTATVMPPLLGELYAAGIRREDITLVFALGSHRANTGEEIKKLAGERAYAEIKCCNGDATDCVHVGTTARGTPVDIVRCVAEADRRVLLGNIEYHYFAGYSGGAKAIMPGVAAREAIQANHSWMTDPGAKAGRLAGNPVREDLEEAADMVGVDFILNVVLDERKQILRAFAGDVRQAHRAGCAFLDTLYRVEAPARADIVIVSPGGAPKDLNLYQAQKALDNARHAVKEGGVIILVGSCREGLGEATFAQWLTEAKAPHELLARIAKGFKLGGHKAAAIAMVLEHAAVYLVSELPEALVQSIFFQPFGDVQSALDAALKRYGAGATVIAMPAGGSTLPWVAGEPA